MPRRALRIAGSLLLPAACIVLLAGPFVCLFALEWRTATFVSLYAPDSPDLPRLTGLLWATVRLLAATTALATVLGTLVAYALRGSTGWRKIWLSALFPIPLLLPPEVVAIAWTHVLGKRGIVAMFWKELAGRSELPFSIYGEAGSACVLALCWFPLVTLTVLVGLRALGSRGDAARLYASPWRRWWKVDLPLLLPYLSSGAACVAWLALGDFDVPSVLLRSAYSVEIYAAFQSHPQVARALALSVPLLALSAAVLGMRQWFARRQAATVEGSWSAAADPAAGSGAASRGIKIAAWLIVALGVLAPLLSLLHQTGSWATVRAALATAGGLQGEILNTFRTALVAAGLSVCLGLPYALLLLRASGWKRAGLALLAILPLALPGTLHGLAWIKTLEPHAWGRELLAWPYLVAVVDAARFFPFAALILAATLGGLHPDLNSAAQGAGASPWRTWWRVTWPLIFPGVAAAFAMTYALSAGELAASILLNPAGFSTLPVRMSSLLHFGKDELLAALCLIHIVLALAPYLLATLWLERTLEARLD